MTNSLLLSILALCLIIVTCINAQCTGKLNRHTIFPIQDVTVLFLFMTSLNFKPNILIYEKKSCLLAHCFFFVDFIWGPWSEFSCCSTTCGAGMAVQTRTCYGSDGFPADCSNCPGGCAASFRNQPCNNNKPCPPAVTCTARGDPHYTTFDTSYYSFQGDCNYTMISTCRSNVPVPFIVTAKNRKSGNVAVISSVALLVPGYHIMVKCDCMDNPCLIIVSFIINLKNLS